MSLKPESDGTERWAGVAFAMAALLLLLAHCATLRQAQGEELVTAAPFHKPVNAPGEWNVAAADSCAGMADAAWWANEALSKIGMTGPIKVTAGADFTAWTRDGAWFVFEVEWRPGEDCVKRWRTRAKESF